MTKSKRAMRRVILGKLFDHLQEHYSFGWSREMFVSDGLSLHELDAILSFKSDPHLSELRSAIDRLEAGSYGVCLNCKHRIVQHALDAEPSRRVCLSCEREIGHAAHAEFPHLHA